jgi:hypothetical protein
MIKFEPRKWSVERRILSVLAYFDIFDLALTTQEIADLALGESLDKKDVEFALKKMAGQVMDDGILYALKGRGVLFDKRAKKRTQADILRKKVLHYVWLFRWVPFVRGVAVCNYLSLGAVDEDSDIDLLVITTPGRIFLARVFLTIYMQLLGVRRHGRKVVGRFCLSFYVSEAALNFEKILEAPYDIYFVYWLGALWPVYGDTALWNKLKKSNDWMSKLKDWKIENGDLYVGKHWLIKMKEFLLGGRFGDLLEKLLNKYFTGKFHKKIGSLPPNASVIVNKEMLKYHNSDRRAFFRNEFEERLKMLGFSD